MNGAHTPGPWKAGYWTGQCHIPEHNGNHPGGDKCQYDTVFFAMEESEYGCSFVGIASEQPGVSVVWTEYDELKIRPADAHLIAAAPELLQVLEDIEELLRDKFLVHTTTSDPVDDPDWLEKTTPQFRKIAAVSEVIRKARGTK